MRFILYASMLSLLLFSCQTADAPPAQVKVVSDVVDTTLVVVKQNVLMPVDTLDYDSTQWLELIDLDTTIGLDIRYATKSNFVGEILYECPRCFLRPEAARAVVAVHQLLKQEGLGLKMFDCYRPRDVQYRLWEIYPKPGYVADPRKGSIHNRGGAVDLTIVDSTGVELDMGTDFDFFGPKANHTCTDLPQKVLANRQKLKAIMKEHGFSAIRSEWWHYNYRGKSYELADEEWPCK